jgi:WD40 repeat protein
MTSPTYALKYTFTEHEGPVFCCTVARYENENPIAITCGFDQTIKIWNLVTGKLHDEFRGHSSAVHALSVIHTTIPGLVSGSADGLIIIWNLITGERLGELVGHTGMIRSLSVTLQPRLMIVSGSYDNTVKIWDITLPGNDSDLLLQINESLQYEEDDNGEKSNVDICNTVEERK